MYMGGDDKFVSFSLRRVFLNLALSFSQEMYIVHKNVSTLSVINKVQLLD